MAREMKDSGIEWIGEIPESWIVKKLKYCTSFVQEKYSIENGDLPYIGLENIISWTGNFIATGSVYDRTESILFSTNDILFGKLRPYLAKVYHAQKEGCCSSEFCVIRVSAPYDSRYFWNLLISSEFISTVDRSTYGTKMPRANADYIKNIRVPVPPEDEQIRISHYLDSECSRIDSVIEQTRASIEQYKKLKQAVITQAVTKGIRPNREMKDSGVEWIGKIPVDWNILALKYLCTMQSGKNLVSEQITETGAYPVYGGNGQRGFFDEYNCEGKRLLVGRQGALCGNVHRVDGKFWATEHAVVTENTRFCDMDFLYYLLIGMNLNQYVSSTAAQPGLAVSTIHNVRTSLPPIDEQIEIAHYLDIKIPEINELVEKKEAFLEELNNYKKSLIFEYVTGKKEVPA